MTRNRNSHARKPTARQIREEKHRRAMILAVVAVSGVATAVAHVAPFFNKQPMHTSILTG